MAMVIIVLYLVACVVTGIMGRKTTIGFIGHFFLSIVITPILDFLIQVAARPNREIRRLLEHKLDDKLDDKLDEQSEDKPDGKLEESEG